MATAPGWYPAPDQEGLVRYWDGEMWTQSARPAPNQRGAAASSTIVPPLSLQRSSVVQARLRPGERLEAGFECRDALWTTSYALATSERLIFVLPQGKLRRGERVIEFGYDEVKIIGLRWNGNVELETADESIQLSPEMNTTSPVEFVAYVRSRMPIADVDLETLPAPGGTGAGGQTNSVAPLPQTAAAMSHAHGPERSAMTGLAAEIAQVAALHRDGILTDAEFAAAKQRLISGD